MKLQWYLKNFDQYFYNGIYRIDAELLPDDISKQLKDALPGDFYSIADIKHIYLRDVSNSDARKINPFTIKALGFRVFSSCAIKNAFQSASEYFNKVLTNHDIVDLWELPKAMIQAIAFTTEPAELKSKYEVIEFSPSHCINIRRLNAVEITKSHLQDYCNQVYAVTERDSYFTIHSL